VLLFAVAGWIVRRLTDVSGHIARPTPLSRWTSVLWIAAAIVLYWPSIGIGLLSDDFPLADRALRGELGFVGRDVFRPLPLALWAVLLRVDGASLLHLTNIVMHGLVAFLTTRLAAAVGHDRRECVAPGLLVLTMPTNVEAVAWSSAIFDVSATLFCVIAVLASRRYDAAPRGAVRAKLFAVAIAALMCKETAAILPLLIVGDAWIRRRLSRALAIDVGYLLAFFGGVAMLRLMSASSLIRQPVTRYVAQRWLFGTLGSLVVPWHVDVVRSWPWVPIVGSICVLILATAFFMRQGSNLRTNEALGWLLWT